MNFCHRYNHILDNQDGFAADALDRVVKLDRIVAPLHLNRAPMKILPTLPKVGIHALQVAPDVFAHCPEGVGVQLQNFFILVSVSSAPNKIFSSVSAKSVVLYSITLLISASLEETIL